MTGRKADEVKLESRKSTEASTPAPASARTPNPTKRRKAHNVVSDSDDESIGHWNIFTEPPNVPSRLRPRSPVWSRAAPGSGQDPKSEPRKAKARSKASSPRRQSAPSSATKPRGRPRKRSVRQTQEYSHPTSDSDAPLASRAKGLLPTPALTRTSSATARRSKTTTIISLESSEERDSSATSQAFLQRAKSAKEIDRAPLQSQAFPANIKAEPLSADAIAQTVFRVSADNMPEKGPIDVPFSHCPTSDDLWTVLSRERKLRGVPDAKISDITATCTWGERKSYGIRKGKPSDWAAFCKYLRKEWDKENNGFEDGCEVHMMIHVDK